MPDALLVIGRALICVVPLILIAGATVAYLYFTRPRMPSDQLIRSTIRRYRKKHPQATDDDVIEACVRRYAAEHEERPGLGPLGGPAGMLGSALGNSFNRGATKHFNDRLRIRVEEVFDRMTGNEDVED